MHGVPHVYGEGEYEVLYGLGYVMARDQLETLVPLYRTANGTRAQREGEGSGGSNVVSDYISHLFRVPESAKAAYATMPPRERTWLEGFADGLNAYIKEYNAAHSQQDHLGVDPDKVLLVGHPGPIAHKSLVTEEIVSALETIEGSVPKVL